MVVVEAFFWLCLAAIGWTHAGYPLVAAALARVRRREIRKADIHPRVLLIVAAYNEEAVIERRLENLLALDYPADRLRIVVASDASSDATDDLVRGVAAHEPRVSLLVCQRGGKVAAQNAAVRDLVGDAEVLAFSDANCTWEPAALCQLVRPFDDPDVAYVCGKLSLLDADGINREGAYWRYEMWLRADESAFHSVTGGNGSIYAVRPEDYLEVDPRMGHDLSFPYRMVQRGRRAVYEPAAVAYEKPSRDSEEEYRRKVRMFEHCWLIVIRGKMLRHLPPLYWLAIISHRHLRYLSGVLHLAALVLNATLLGQGPLYLATFAAQLAVLGLALIGRLRLRVPFAALAWYYTLVSVATLRALINYLRRGVPPVWEKAAGTR